MLYPGCRSQIQIPKFLIPDPKSFHPKSQIQIPKVFILDPTVHNKRGEK
jgi:hypothetical protein